MFKVCNKDTRTTLASFWCLYCELWTYFTPCFSVSIVNFEHGNAGWAGVEFAVSIVNEVQQLLPQLSTNLIVRESILMNDAIILNSEQFFAFFSFASKDIVADVFLWTLRSFLEELRGVFRTVLKPLNRFML